MLKLSFNLKIIDQFYISWTPIVGLLALGLRCKQKLRRNDHQILIPLLLFTRY